MDQGNFLTKPEPSVATRRRRPSIGLLSAVVFAFVAACSSTTEPTSEARCRFHDECPNGGVCFEGTCSPTVSCLERRNCNTVPICEGQRCICSESSNRCLPVCVTDNDCSSDGHCVNGVCTLYPVRFDGAPPPSGARGSLKVGLARVELDFPMGVSLAGYGSRRGPRTPYQDQLGGSNAWLDKPDVRAIAFDDGKEMFVLLRLPMGWSTDEMHTALALKVLERTGLDLTDHIVTSSMHSHAHPARFWHLVKGLGFGYFGYDEFNFEVFDRLTTSFADAVVMALENMRPARFGYVVLDAFDPEDRIHRDRRDENNGLPGYTGKDDRMVVMRVDDASGRAIAVLTNFGMHGTVFDLDNPIVTGDAPGGVEVALTLHASAKFERPVLGFFIQGNGGDISPAGDDMGHPEIEQLQVIGERAWELIEPALDRISTSAAVEVGVVMGRVPVSHAILGYGPGEYRDMDVSCESTPDYFRYGAFQCVNGRFHDEDPGTSYSDGDLDCVFSVECLTNGYAIPQFAKSHLAIARLGDLAFATVPGEPASQYGRALSERVKDAIPGVRAAAVIGYSMDDHRYILSAEDWLQGGYEPSFGLWGWRIGPYFADRSVDLAKLLAVPPEERVVDNGNLKPMYWDDPPEERVPVAFTETEGDPAEVLSDVPSTIERMDIIDFAWRGGHPGLDRPLIVLEEEKNGGFVPVRRPGGLPYDDSAFEMLVHYDGACTKSNCAEHAWRVTWEERRDFPTGRYRFHATGRALRGGAIVGYSATSRPFDLVPSRRLAIYDLRVTGDRIEGRIVDPPAVLFRQDGARRVADGVGHLLRSPLVPSWLGAPISESIDLTASGTIRRTSSQANGEPLRGSVRVEIIEEPRQRIRAYDASGAPEWGSAGTRPTSKFMLSSDAIASGPPGGEYLVTLTLTDGLGNSGTATATIAK